MTQASAEKGGGRAGRTLKAVQDDTTEGPRSADWDPRRTEIIRAATGLFLSKGYAQTSMADIGKLVGMSGPALYHYFKGKAEILGTASAHADLRLREEMTAAQKLPPKDALNALIESYVTVTIEEPTFIAVWLRDRDDIAPIMGEASPRLQRQYIEEWVLTLGRVRPTLRNGQLRVLIQAALGAINSIALYKPDVEEDELKVILTDVAQTIVRAAVPGGKN